MIKTQISLWKTIGGNRRLGVGVRVGVRFLLILFWTRPHWTVICSRLHLDGKKHKEAMSDEQPREHINLEIHASFYKFGIN